MSRRKVGGKGPLDSVEEELENQNDIVSGSLDQSSTGTDVTEEASVSSSNNKQRSVRNVEYLVLGTDHEGAEVVICSFRTLHQLRKYYLPLSGAFRHSYHHVRWLKAKSIMGG